MYQQEPSWLLVSINLHNERLGFSLTSHSATLHAWWISRVSTYCPCRDFAQKAKSRRGTLVTCAYIKESTNSWNIQSYSQYRKNLDLLGQGPRGIMMTFLLFAPASTKWLGWRKDRKSRRSRSGRFCYIYCTVTLRYSFALHSDILWSSCFESYGPKDTR